MIARPEIGDVNSNPHLLQVIASSGVYTSHTDVPFTRVLSPDAPRLPYRRRKGEVKTVLHWGQRKLLISEIEFLTLYGNGRNLVVYAGAAPGTHVRYLIRLFPHAHFVLVDPAPSALQTTSDGKVVVLQEMFTDDVARKFADRDDVLFLSDVRSGDPNREGMDEHEKVVVRDMRAQEAWCRIIKPVKAMLKFRLPWSAGSSRLDQIG